jgi:hypothetical protein
MGGKKALFCRKIMEACEVKEHGHDSKQRHQVERPIMQAKECMREFGRCNLWSPRAQKSLSEDDHAGGKPSQGGHKATQAGRPPLFKHPPVLLLDRQATHPTLCLCAQICSPEPL